MHFQALDLDIGDDLRLVVKNDIRIDDRPLDREAGGTGQQGVDGGRVDDRALLATESAEDHIALYPGTTGGQLPGKGTGPGLPDPSGQTDAGKPGSLVHVNGQRSATRKNIDIGVKLSVIAIAVSDYGITLCIAPDGRNNIVHAYAKARARSGYCGNRTGNAAADFYANRAILVGDALGCETDPARRRIAATALGQPERWSGDVQAADPGDAVSVIG